MLKVQHRMWADYKRGILLPDLSPKLVLEASETHTAEQAMDGYDRDPRSHRPHYLVDPQEYVVYKLSDTAYSVVGDFHPTAPHRNVRCIFAAIVKETALELSEENTIRAGRLLGGICDLESISHTAYQSEPDNDELGFDTLKNLEGILCWYLFPGDPSLTTPGKINWDQLCEGISLGLDLLEPEPLDVDVPTPEAVADATILGEIPSPVPDGNGMEPPEQEQEESTKPEPATPSLISKTVVSDLQAPDLDALRVVDLKVMAKDLGITTTDKNKAALVAAIREAQS